MCRVQHITKTVVIRYNNIQTYAIRNVEKNGGIKRRNGSAEELDRETGEEQTSVGRTRRKDGGRQTADERGRVTLGGQEETREAKGETGGLKRDVEKTGEEEYWKKKAIDRGWWKRLSDESVKQLRAAPHPDKGKQEEEREVII